jgi:phosphoribosylamine--glycine ligase
MGAYAPVKLIDQGMSEQLVASVMQPTINTLAEQGKPFVGVLYAGLMLTAEGPRVLEFNARFGDPETQVLLPLLQTDLLEILLACVEGRLVPELVRWNNAAALGVVLAAEDYPAQPRTGDIVVLPDELDADTLIFQAGTAEQNGRIVSAGGRVLTVVGVGADLEQAHARAYALAERVQFRGKHMRRDIGRRGLGSGAQA